MLVKICGMTTADNARDCAREFHGAGADMLGFIFHPSSPRNTGPELPASLDVPVRKVGVFVKQSADEVNATLEAGGLDLAQLHGGQDEAFCRAVGPRRVIKVFWPERYKRTQDLQADMDRFTDCAHLFLLDAGSSGGGHGRAMDFSLLAGLQSPKPWLLAGGLGPDNLRAALIVCADLPNFAGVDLNSGLESSPGCKDPELVRRAMNICKPTRSAP